MEHILAKDDEEVFKENYWLAPEKKTGNFELDLGCEMRVSMVELVNTHNADKKDRSTKEFKVFLSKEKSGPWEEVIHSSLKDSREAADPLPIERFSFAERFAKFVKFELLTFYGNGGGLQYFHVKGRITIKYLEDVNRFSRSEMSETQEAEVSQESYPEEVLPVSLWKMYL